MRFLKPAAALLAALAVSAAHASGDRVILTTGRVIEGIIETSTTERVTLRTADGVVGIQRTQIRAIARSSEADRALQTARWLAAAGDERVFLEALAALRLGAPPSAYDGVLAQATAALLAAPERRLGRTAATALATYLEDRPVTAAPILQTDALRLLARDAHTTLALQLAYRAADHAGAFPRDLQTALADTIRGLVEGALAGGDTNAALAALQALVRIAGPAQERPLATLVRLSEADRLDQSGDPEGAIRLIAAEVYPHAPALAYQRSLSILRSAPAALRDGAYTALFDGFQNSGFAGELPPRHVERIETLLRTGEYERAQQAAARFARTHPDEAAPYQHRVTLARRRAGLPPDDTAALYRLAQWASERDLIAEALDLFAAAAKDPRLAENAALQQETLRARRDARDVEVAFTAFRERRFADAVAEARRILTARPQTTYRRTLETLAALADYAEARTEELRPVLAESLFQSAERAYFQEKYDEAISLLNRLQTDYAGTEAAAKAASLRPRTERSAEAAESRRVRPREVLASIAEEAAADLTTTAPQRHSAEEELRSIYTGLYGAPTR